MGLEEGWSLLNSQPRRAHAKKMQAESEAAFTCNRHHDAVMRRRHVIIM